MTAKYELIDEPGTNLKRLCALRSFSNVTAGDLGGLIEREENLGHEGNCWVYNNATVCGAARVMEAASVYDSAQISGAATISGNAAVADAAWVGGTAQITAAASVTLRARVCGAATVTDSAVISDDAQVSGNARVSLSGKVLSTARVYDSSHVTGSYVVTEGEVRRLFPGEVESHGEGNQLVVLADCFQVMAALPENSISAVVTDPPYGVKEYDDDQIEKMNAGVGGIWRIPPAIGGHVRSPLPRFTALNEQERARVAEFFEKWSEAVYRVLAPGGHVFLASNAFLSQVVFSAIVKSGLEFRGEVIRIVRTLRGGDRPKNAEKEFPDVCSMPRGCYEPWGIFRKPLEGTVAQNLRKWGTGGLRRFKNGNPFCDLIPSERTPSAERDLCDHPSLKPQSLMRLLVYVSLPLGKGIVLDPFAGSGSTIAAAKRLGYSALGVERSRKYFNKSKGAVERLAEVRCAESFLDNSEPMTDEVGRVEDEVQLRLV